MDLALDAVAAAFRKLALDEAENVRARGARPITVMLHVLPGRRQDARGDRVQGVHHVQGRSPGSTSPVRRQDRRDDGDHRSRPARAVRTGRRAGRDEERSPAPTPPPSAVRHRQAAADATPRGLQGAAIKRFTSTAATRARKAFAGGTAGDGR